MIIQRIKKKRTITEEEFLRLKKIEPFATYRQDSKAINFGMLFGMSFKKFSMATLETAWNIDRVKDFIRDKHLEESVEVMKDRYPDVEEKLWSYYAVSKYIRDNFFDTYKGLMERIKRNEQLGKDLGYIRSHHGGIRRVPMLSLAIGEDGKYRKGENLKEISNLVNITSNTSIQTDEICTVASSMLEWASKDNPYIDFSPIIGTVHDSIDFYTDKDHAVEAIERMKKTFEHTDEWQHGIALLVDITVVDLEREDHYYKHGWENKDFIKAVKG